MLIVKEICILSGKGGAGKTSIVASIAILLANKKSIVACDCDVDAPNLALLLGNPDKIYCEKISASEKAFMLPGRCRSYKKCLNTCRFNAITWDDEISKPEIRRFLCEGCGACAYTCPSNAIEIRPTDTGKVCLSRSDYGFSIVTGQLKLGETGSGKIVDAVRRKALEAGRVEDAELILLDSAAGIGCPVISSVKATDHVIIVAEANMVALNDFRRVLQLVRHFKIPHSIIINKWDINKDVTKKIESFAEESDIPVLGKIPYTITFIEALTNLAPAVLYDPRLEKLFKIILNNLRGVI